MHISYILVFMFASRLLPSYPFILTNRRFICKTPTLLSARKKTVKFDTDSYEDHSVPYGRSKKLTPTYKPRSRNQKQYVQSLQNTDFPIVLGIGPAGCGKTMFACLQAIQDLRSGKVDKIILTRPIVPVEEEELGFLPGNLVKKMDPWTRPIFDIFSEYYQQRDIENMIHCGTLEISPLAYMRGRTFKRAFIIADEMQNSTPNQMLMLTTRIGEHSKMVITGDLKQSDRNRDNGLLDIMHKLRGYQAIPRNDEVSVDMIEMNAKDIQRSPIVSQILSIYQNNHTSIDSSLISVGSDSLAVLSQSQDTLSETDGQYRNKTSTKASNNDAAIIPLQCLPINNFPFEDRLI